MVVNLFYVLAGFKHEESKIENCLIFFYILYLIRFSHSEWFMAGAYGLFAFVYLKEFLSVGSYDNQLTNRNNP